MTPVGAATSSIGFPRHFRIAGRPVNAYKVLMCVGMYVGSLSTAGVATHLGLSPLMVGMAAAISALAGIAGARWLFLGIGPHRAVAPSARWDAQSGGMSVFGGLLTFVPASLVFAVAAGISAPTLWDVMAFGVLTGGFWIRLGCVFNGCCTGRPSASPLAVRLHDVHGRRVSRLPVQYMEMAWWAAGTILYLCVWPTPLAPGSYALGVVAWYGAGRTVLEPLREHPDGGPGGWLVNQVIAASLAVAAMGGLAALN